ncbi:hypothetical protein P8C59_008645 [Phyllachora maydis]|uniref:Uncharacterized protein n=1 Tax=Phyllachora maydis TaxID=1825666 RepID=A0AAD9IB22_9PEZI|nr:hypothetical protein P8C59_008645 [Phyllachora maydis]
MADQAKGKGIAPKRASNPADSGQSSRPLPPIRTLLEDKEDGKDYSKVIEVLKQHIKCYKRDSVSAIKNISSTLASLTNSSNAAATTTGKTSYSPRFDPFSGTIDSDSPLYPPRKEPYLGLAVNSATSNLDPPIDIGSKEGSIRYAAAYKAKRRKSAKAYAIAGRAAYKLAKKEDLQRSKRTAGGNAGRYTTDSGLIADKDDNDAYNRAYIPLTNTEEEEEKEEEDGSSNDNSVNSGTSDSANKGKGSDVYERSKGALCYKDILLYKRQRIISYPYSPPGAPYADIYVYYV